MIHRRKCRHRKYQSKRSGGGGAFLCCLFFRVRPLVLLVGYLEIGGVGMLKKATG
jgi:hypothetical protein